MEEIIIIAIRSAKDVKVLKYFVKKKQAIKNCMMITRIIYAIIQNIIVLNNVVWIIATNSAKINIIIMRTLNMIVYKSTNAWKFVIFAVIVAI